MNSKRWRSALSTALACVTVLATLAHSAGAADRKLTRFNDVGPQVGSYVCGGGKEFVTARIESPGWITGDAIVQNEWGVVLNIGDSENYLIGKNLLHVLVTTGCAIQVGGDSLLVHVNTLEDMHDATVRASINHIGIVEAKSLAIYEDGRIMLLGE